MSRKTASKNKRRHKQVVVSAITSLPPVNESISSSSQEKKGNLAGREVVSLKSEDPFSLSTRAFIQCLASDVFFPSNYPLRKIKDLGSISRSLAEAKIDLFDKGKKTQDTLYIGKIARIFAREIASQFIGLVIAPMGILYHGAQAISHIVKYLRRTSDQSEEIKKINKQAQLVLQELATFLAWVFIDLVIVVGYWFPLLLLRIPPLILTGCMLHGYFSITFFPLLCLRSVTHFYNTQSYACVKSFLLKNDFGIASEKGKPLTWDVDKDREFVFDFARDYKPGVDNYLTDTYKKKAVELLDVIKELKLLYEDQIDILEEYPYRSLKLFDNKEEDFNTRVAFWKSEFERIVKDITYMHSALFKIKHDISIFPLSKYECEVFFNWQGVIESHIQINSLTNES